MVKAELLRRASAFIAHITFATLQGVVLLFMIGLGVNHVIRNTGVPLKLHPKITGNVSYSGDISFAYEGEITSRLHATFIPTDANRAGQASSAFIAVSEENHLMEVKPASELKSGQYKLQISDVEGDVVYEQTVLWGVLGLNANKSVYQPGENAQLQMAVLDMEGRTVCDSAMELTLEHPQSGQVSTYTTGGGGIVVNDICSVYAYHEVPDYEAAIPLLERGIYKLTLKAIVDGEERITTAELPVEDAPVFSVERASVMRLYPPETYPMRLKLTANRDYTGPLHEPVPDDFMLSLLEGLPEFSVIEDETGGRALVWMVDMKAGQVLELGYRYQSPNVSPQKYVFGPLLLPGAGLSEQRAWNLVNDVANVTVSGVVYSDAGTAALGSGRTVRIKVNGIDACGGACADDTDGSGAYSISNVTVTSGDILTIWLDDETERASTVTVVGTETNVSGLHLYQDHLIVRREGAAALTNANLALWDSANDTDMVFDVSGDNLTLNDGIALYVWGGDEFEPGGAVTTSPSANAALSDGDVHIDETGVLAMGQHALSIGGDLVNEGTLAVSASQNTTFTATAAGHSLSVADDTLGNVIFNGSGGGWSFATNTALAGDLTMTAGVLAGSADITINGNSISGAGTIALTGGTFNVNNGGTFSNDENWSFGDLSFGGVPGEAQEIAHEGHNTYNNTAGVTTTSSMTVPAGQVGDVALLTITVARESAGSGVSFDTPAGWTVVTYDDDNTQYGTAVTVFAKTINTPSTESVTVTWNASGSYGAVIDRYSGVASIGVSSSLADGNNATSTTLDVPSISPSSGSTVALMGVTGWQGPWTANWSTAESGFAELHDAQPGASFMRSDTAAGATGVLTISVGDATDFWGGAAVELLPASASATTAALGEGAITASSLAIGTGRILEAGSKTYHLTGSTNPFMVSGTFTKGTSTVSFESSAGHAIPTEDYHHLQLNPATGSPVYTIPAPSLPNDPVWYGSGYMYRKKLTIDSALVGGSTPLTDFPMLVSFTDADLATTSNGGDVTSASGYDIIFADTSGTPAQWSHEIESYDPATGQITMWVEVPSLSHDTDTEFYVYYGNAAVTTSQENAADVWSEYEAVYHFHDDFTDSSGTQSAATNYGSTNVASLFGNGQDFELGDGTDRISAGNWSVSGNAATLQAWIKPESLTESYADVLVKTNGNDNNQDYAWMIDIGHVSGATYGLDGWLKTGTSDASGTVPLYATSNSSLTAGSWALAAVTYDGSTLSVVRNGVQARTGSLSGNLRENAWEISIGNQQDSLYPYDGIIDEVRISGVYRNTDWLKTEYDNATNQGAGSGKFLKTVAAEEEYSAGSGPLTVAGNLELKGAGAATLTLAADNEVLITGDMMVGNGAALSGEGTVAVSGGDVTGAGSIALTAGEFTLDGTGQFGGGSYVFHTLTLGDGTGSETTTGTNGTVTVAGTLTVAVNQTYSAGSQTIAMTAAGTPFVVEGVFNAETSTVSYESTTGATIANADYYNLYLNPASGTATFTFEDSQTADTAWYDSDFTYRKKLTIDSTLISGSNSLTDFPVLVSFTDADLATTANGGKVTSASGNDIIFADATSSPARLDHEIHHYDAVTGQVAMWVRLPELDDAADTEFFVYYGNGAISSSQENASGTWNGDYEAVLHLSESGAGSNDEFKDSSGNGHHGTGGGLEGAGNASYAPARENVAIIGPYSQDFGTGTADDVIRLDNVVDGAWTAVSVQCWVYHSGNADMRIFAKTWGTGASDIVWQLGTDIRRTKIRHRSNSAAGTYNGTTDLGAGTWKLLSYTWDGSTDALRTYINGSVETSTTAGGSDLYDNATPPSIGNVPDRSRGFIGNLQECRLSNVARSQDWFATEFNNVNNQGIGSGKFIKTLGTEEEVVIQPSGAYSIANNLEIKGDGAATLDVNTDDIDLDIDGSLIIGTNATFEASDSADLLIGTNFTASGSFTHHNGTVTLDSPLTATVTGTGTVFYNMKIETAGKDLLFGAGETFRIDGTLTVTGTAGSLVSLNSTDDDGSPAQWFINHQGTESITYASIKNAGCDGTSTTLSADDGTSTNGGNNGECWDFGISCGPIVYEGATSGSVSHTDDFVTINSPAGQTSDVLIAYVHTHGNLGADMALESITGGGLIWTQVGTTADVSTSTHKYFYRSSRVTTSEAVSVTVTATRAPTSSQGESITLNLWRYSGVASAPVGDSSSYLAPGQSTLVTGGSLTINECNTSVLVATQQADLAQTFTAPTDWIERYDADAASIFDRQVLETAAHNPAATSTGNGYISYGTHIELQPEGSISNTAPDAPTVLIQKKTTGGNIIATGGWTNETQAIFEATVSDPDNPDVLNLCIEIDVVGVAFSDEEDQCGANVAYGGSGLTASVTVTGLSDTAQYHWQARTKDAAGAYSAWVSYGDNDESERDFGIDTTAPTNGTVYDGASTGVDVEFSDDSLNILKANWSGFNADVAGLAGYEYAIGTSPGGTDIIDYVQVATATSMEATGLSLRTSQVYYTSVRITDNAGNTAVVTSDGQVVTPSLSFSVTPSVVTFDSLNAGNGWSDTLTSTLATSTNAYNGYVVRSYSAPMEVPPGATAIGGFTGGTYAEPDGWQPGDTGIGYTTSDTSVQGFDKFGENPCAGGNEPPCYAPLSQTAPGDIIADHTNTVSGSPVTSEEFIATLKVAVDAAQAAGFYRAILIYTVTATY